MKSKLNSLVILGCIVFASCAPTNQDVLLFFDDFSGLKRGPLSNELGAYTEYHYLPEAAPKGNWAVSNDRGWWSVREADNERFIYQSKTDELNYAHPMVIAGDEFWEDYNFSVCFKPESKKYQSGIVFRYQNDRCYYFFGVEKNKVILKMVKPNGWIGMNSGCQGCKLHLTV